MTENNLEVSQVELRKNDPKYMYFHGLGENFEKISSPISVLIRPGPVLIYPRTPKKHPGSTNRDDRENTI